MLPSHPLQPLSSFSDLLGSIIFSNLISCWVLKIIDKIQGLLGGIRQVPTYADFEHIGRYVIIYISLLHCTGRPVRGPKQKIWGDNQVCHRNPPPVTGFNDKWAPLRDLPKQAQPYSFLFKGTGYRSWLSIWSSKDDLHHHLLVKVPMKQIPMFWL